MSSIFSDRKDTIFLDTYRASYYRALQEVLMREGKPLVSAILHSKELLSKGMNGFFFLFFSFLFFSFFFFSFLFFSFLFFSFVFMFFSFLFFSFLLFLCFFFFFFNRISNFVATLCVRYHQNCGGKCQRPSY